MLIVPPIVGIVIATKYAPTPELAVGFVLLATCPGGMLSNLMTDLSKGDLALSMSFTIAVSFIYIFTVPFYAHFALLHFMGQSREIDVPMLGFIGSIFSMTLVPVTLGVLVRRFKSELAIKLRGYIKIVGDDRARRRLHHDPGRPGRGAAPELCIAVLDDAGLQSDRSDGSLPAQQAGPAECAADLGAVHRTPDPAGGHGDLHRGGHRGQPGDVAADDHEYPHRPRALYHLRPRHAQGHGQASSGAGRRCGNRRQAVRGYE